MKKKRHSEAQIRAILLEKEEGTSVADISEKHGISEQTYYRWKRKYDFEDNGITETKSPPPQKGLNDIRKLEQENKRLKMLLGELILEKSYD